jgi:hypothetical protein
VQHPPHTHHSIRAEIHLNMDAPMQRPVQQCTPAGFSTALLVVAHEGIPLINHDF